MADDLLSIGAFSRASSISVRTLRNYHESGLLVPASIDPASGYRSYTVDQLADAVVIVRLRDLDVPLSGVHRVVAARDPEVTRQVLSDHARTMQARLAETERIVESLHHGLPSSATPPHLIVTDASHTVQRTARVPSEHLWPWITETAVALRRIAGDQSAVGALYTGSLTDESFEDVTVLVTVADPPLVPSNEAGITVGELPAGHWAVLTHTDGFSTVGDAYRLLGAWVARNTTAHPDGPIWELYPTIHTGRGASDSVIELRWPLVPPGIVR
jgi:DNA-binding transcriptional MerR regulator